MRTVTVEFVGDYFVFASTVTCEKEDSDDFIEVRTLQFVKDYYGWDLEGKYSECNIFEAEETN